MEQNKLVVLRCGNSLSYECKSIDECLKKLPNNINGDYLILFVNFEEFDDNEMIYEFELYDSYSLIFFYRNRHIMVDFGTGNNNQLNWRISDPEDLIMIFEVIYNSVIKGKFKVNLTASKKIKKSL